MAINATAVWRVRPSGSNTNGGGYDAGISGAATDYSQQNSAQASGTNGTASGTTAFSDTTAAAFTSAMVGNALYITGTGLTTGFYFCTAFTDASHITIDRSPGTGTTGTWHLGGGWADFWTNCSANIVPGNTVYILGSGTPNPASYTFDYTTPSSAQTPVSGNATAGFITFANDPSTPGYKAPPDTTGGMPCIKGSQIVFYSCSGIKAVGLWIVVNDDPGSNYGMFRFSNAGAYLVEGVIVDQTTFNVSAFNGLATFGGSIIGCEFFSSTGGAASHTQPVIYCADNMSILGNNIHDCNGPGIFAVPNDASSVRACNNIIAKNNGYGLKCQWSNSDTGLVTNNTIDGNSGNAIEIVDQTTLYLLVCINNIISNHTGGGTYGMTVDAGTAAANSKVQEFVDYNTFYNNTTNYNAISAGPHDTALSSNPYVGQSTENYTLA